MTQSELFMLRALELAKLGTGAVSPNPRVGCVIVHQDKIVGEGWHNVFGEPHAEVNAIESVVDKSVLHESTVYVTLEPCSHTGKTPPCADLLIRSKIPRVIIAVEDPNPLVAGQGIRKLTEAGVQVSVGLLSKEAALVNSQFFVSIKTKRPYVILKWAQTADGFIAPLNRERKWISGARSRQLVHKWRTELDAILIGSDTAIHDDPQLNVREWVGRNPIRIVLDRNLKLSSDLRIFNGSQQTICYNLEVDKAERNLSFVKLSKTNFLLEMLGDLANRGVQSLMIEGGSTLHTLFIEANLWNEARIFYSPIKFNEGIRAPVLNGIKSNGFYLDNDFLEILLNQTH